MREGNVSDKTLATLMKQGADSAICTLTKPHFRLMIDTVGS